MEAARYGSVMDVYLAIMLEALQSIKWPPGSTALGSPTITSGSLLLVKGGWLLMLTTSAWLLLLLMLGAP